MPINMMVQDDDDDEGFSFGDFKSAPPSPPPPQSHQLFPANGNLTSTSKNDVVWADFFFTPTPQPQNNLSNGFSFSSNTNTDTNTPKTSINSNPSRFGPDPGFHKPRGALPLSLFGEPEEEEEQQQEQDKKVDNSGGDDRKNVNNGNKINSNSNGWFDPNPPAQNGDLFGKLHFQTQQIKPDIGSALNFDGSGLKFDGSGLKFDGSGLKFGGSGSDLKKLDQDEKQDEEEDEDGEWEFMGANYSQSGQGGGFVSSGSKVEPVMVMVQEKQAGQDASNSTGHHPDPSSYSPQVVDLFAAHPGAVQKSNEMDIGFDCNFNSAGHHPNPISSSPQVADLFAAHPGAAHKSSEIDMGFNGNSNSSGHYPHPSSNSPQVVDLFATHSGAVQKSSEMDIGFNFNPNSVVTSNVMWDPFPGVGESGNGNGISATAVNEEDEFDDFGDFIDASQEVHFREQEQVVPQTNPAEAQLPNGTIKNKQTRLEGALPVSLFSDATEESIDSLSHQDEMIPKPISNPRNGFPNQGPGISIQDLLSNLYSQAQQTSSVDSDERPAENGVHFPPKNISSTPLSGYDDWDDNSWEFKDASSETEVKERSSSHTTENVLQRPSEISSNLLFYMDFYASLRDALCVLLSHQLDEVKKAQSSSTVIGNNGKEAAIGDDIQEAYKLLEDAMVSEEVLAEKHMEGSTCLSKVLEAVQGSKYKVIESEYSLSKRLQMAPNDWRMTTELLRHAISLLHILSLGSADEQDVYVSTWSKIINVGAEELKHGALIWKKAFEKNLRHHLLSDHRVQQYILALGEIYKIIELLGLSAKLYKPWIFSSLSDPGQFFVPLDECCALWSSSGLEEALKIMSDDVNFGCDVPAKASFASTKSIRDLDVFSVHDGVFVQQKSICRLSLLPLEMLADLKTVVWNDKPYFLNLANLWANLISYDPPQLPNLHVN